MPVPPRVLILAQDNQKSETVGAQLRAAGLEVSIKTSAGGEAPQMTEPPVDVLVISSEGQGMSDASLVREVRAKSVVPILVTGHLADVELRLAIFAAGADDILVEPFDPRELAARVMALLRRSQMVASGAREAELKTWEFEGLIVPPTRRRITLDGQPVELTTAEFDLLRLLVSHAPRVLSRDLLLEQLRGVEWENVDRSIDILVSRLRDKLGDNPREPRFIRTVRSEGYQFIGKRANT